MSSNDGLRLRQLPDSTWVGYLYLAPEVESEAGMLAAILAQPNKWKHYPSLEEAHAAYRDVALDTEYGFDIVWYHATPGQPNEETQELIDLSKAASATLPLNEVVDDTLSRLRPIAIERPPVPQTSFGQELTSLINRHSKENESGTPDFVLARFLERQLWIFKETVEQRASWRGESVELYPPTELDPAAQGGEEDSGW